MESFITLTLLRLLIPLLILRFPLAGILLSSLCDVYDWKFFPFSTQTDYTYYQTWDKWLDMYYLTLAVYMVRFWKHTRMQYTAYVLYAVRILGVLLFETTQMKSLLFLFPNVFENFFIFTQAVLLFKHHIPFLKWRIILGILLALFIPKVIHEYFMHILNHQPWEYWNLAQDLGLQGVTAEYSNYLLFGGAFQLPLLLLISLFVLQKQSKHKHS